MSFNNSVLNLNMLLGSSILLFQVYWLKKKIYNRCFKLNCSPTANFPRQRKNKQAAWQRRADDACEWPSAQREPACWGRARAEALTGEIVPHTSTRPVMRFTKALLHSLSKWLAGSSRTLSLQTPCRDVSFFNEGCTALIFPIFAVIVLVGWTYSYQPWCERAFNPNFVL